MFHTWAMSLVYGINFDNVQNSQLLYEVRNLNNTISIDDCNTSLGKDAMNRVSTNDLFVAFFF
ncbi:hypothetical protein NIES4072_46920 [Nostoc commune NIES-4072]|uniref:Uncharacterized protein n=1 Tax=Nostoc commune NIES-4072 TaxID=2005467 RepID=A0A2R5FQH0_NOSCO|nr:hypothetical protein [Nostoc commune]BBD67996.1 hypothetical protein NIES4070_43910 [Nostoc commune HK-02]GBG21010.1 hypothetical protein NIES4072_46920 [Nostoc commune NIES-4072]